MRGWTEGVKEAKEMEKEKLGAGRKPGVWPLRSQKKGFYEVGQTISFQMLPRNGTGWRTTTHSFLDWCGWKSLVPLRGDSRDRWVWKLGYRNLPAEWEALKCSVHSPLRSFAMKEAEKCGGNWKGLDTLISSLDSASWALSRIITYIFA